MTISQALELAVSHHQAGRLADAEALYRQILATQPNHHDALHLLGVIAHQAGRHDLAVDWIRRAIVITPSNPAAHCNLGRAVRALGRLEEAAASYRRALELKPGHLQAQIDLAAVLAALGRLDEAIDAWRRALQIDPTLAEAHSNLGNALRVRGRFDEAVASCRHAVELSPGNPEAQVNLGAALAAQGRLDEAIAAYRGALQIKPGLPEAHNNLGLALRRRGRPDEAMAAFQHALQLNPGYPNAHNNLGAALAGQGRLDEAVTAFHRALHLKPDHPEALNNLGNTLRERGQPDDAVAVIRRALELKPDYSDAHNNLGSALKDLCLLDEALAAYRRAIQLEPEHASAHSNLVFALHLHPGHNIRTIAEERHRWNRQFSHPLKRFILPHPIDPAVARPLRIGYVSPDFRDHVVGRNLLPLFRFHDRLNFEVLCYSGVAQPDQLTDEIRRHARQWRNAAGVEDETLAEMIRQDGVDILVDLTQHLAGNRLAVFARKPAPIQASFAGYPESTGLDAIEYRISDRHLEAGSANVGTGSKERVCLIDSFWCYDPCGEDVEVNGLPAGESGQITYGCLNNVCKVNEPVLGLWARVLGRVANSRLVLLSTVGSHRQRILETLGSEGVEAHRVEFVEYRPRREYLETYHRLDIVLDTAPYNGHTTSLDALWMGVPVVSLVGETPVSRAGVSQLTNLGLPELAAHSEEDYVRIAVELAGNLARLSELRSTLRSRMKASVLMDAPRFARNIEAAYRSMWEAWRQRHSPPP